MRTARQARPAAPAAWPGKAPARPVAIRPAPGQGTGPAVARRSLAGRVAGTLRTTTFEGREHLVVPVIALVEGVIHASNADTPELVRASELEETIAGWNGRPVVLNHPELSDGGKISANDPVTLEDYRIGTLFNARIEGTKLKAEAWIDVAKTMTVAGGDQMLERIRAAEVIEVSVGAFVDAKNEHGIYQGKQYDAVWTQVVPDHFALLPSGLQGACSVEMGCGTRAAANSCHDSNGQFCDKGGVGGAGGAETIKSGGGDSLFDHLAGKNSHDVAVSLLPKNVRKKMGFDSGTPKKKTKKKKAKKSKDVLFDHLKGKTSREVAISLLPKSVQKKMGFLAQRDAANPNQGVNGRYVHQDSDDAKAGRIHRLVESSITAHQLDESDASALRSFFTDGQKTKMTVRAQVILNSISRAASAAGGGMNKAERIRALLANPEMDCSDGVVTRLLALSDEEFDELEVGVGAEVPWYKKVLGLKKKKVEYSDMDLRRELEEGLRGEAGFMGLDSVFSDHMIYMVMTGDAVKTFKRSYSQTEDGVEVGDDAEEVTPVTRYEPTAASAVRAACGCSSKEEENMEKKERIKALIAGGLTVFVAGDEKALEALSDDRLKALEDKASADKKAADDKIEADKKEADEKIAAELKDAAAKKTDTETPEQRRAALLSENPDLKALLEKQKSDEDTRRSAAIKTLSEAKALTEAQAKTVSLEVLESMASAISKSKDGVDRSLGIPRGTNLGDPKDNEIPKPRALSSYWDKKEKTA